MDAVVHVFDPGEPGKTRDFTCSIHTLTHGMRYFKGVLQKAVESRTTPVEISVHCDVAVFEWLLSYCNGRVTRDHITVQGVLPLLIASNFLQMDALVGDCLGFMASNLVAVAQHQQQLAGQGGDLTALPLELLTKLAKLVSERKLEELASLTPADVRARHMPLVNRLYKYKLEGCLRDLRTTVARCSVCQGLFSLADRAKLDCPGPPPPPQPKGADGHGVRGASSHAQRRSSSSSEVHIPDAAWRLQEHLSALRAQQIPWRGIYWHVWGLVHVLYCHTCMQYAPAAELRRCAFHPQPPVFTGTVAPAPAAASGAASRQPPTGFYPCCGGTAIRGADPRVVASTGCCAREHRLIPSGQAPGAPLPPGLTPQLLNTLQHCTSLFTNPGALLVRDSSGGGAPRNGALGLDAAAGDKRRPVGAGATSNAAGATAAAAAAMAFSAVNAKSPMSRHVSFLGNSAGALKTAQEEERDADGRPLPSAIQAVLSSAAAAASASAPAATQLRNDGATLGPATAATAAALGYDLNLSGMPGLDSGASGPGPPLLLQPQPPQEQQSSGPQSPRPPPPGLAPAVNLPLQITGNPLVDAQRVAAAMIRRLSRTGGGESGGGGPSMEPAGSGPAAAGLAQQQRQQHREQEQLRNAAAKRDHQHQDRLPHQQQKYNLQQPRSRRPVLDTARSFTSLAALRQEAEEAEAAAASTSTLSPTTAREAATWSAPGGDLDRPGSAGLQQPAACGGGGGAEARGGGLKIGLKPLLTLQTGGYAGGGGSPKSFERSPRRGNLVPRSPTGLQHGGHHDQHQAQPPSAAPSGPSVTRVSGGGGSATAGRGGSAGSGSGSGKLTPFTGRGLDASALQALQYSAPPPSPPGARSGAATRGGSRDLRDASPPRGGGGATAGGSGRVAPHSATSLVRFDSAAAATTVGVPGPSDRPRLESPRNPQQQQLPASYLQPPPPPPSSTSLHQQQLTQPHNHSHLQANRDRALHRAQADHSNAAPRREATLPPRPMGRTTTGPRATGLHRRHSGGSWSRPKHGYAVRDTDSGDGGEDDDEGLQTRVLLRKGSGADLGSFRSSRSVGFELPPGAFRGAAGGNGGGGGFAGGLNAVASAAAVHAGADMTGGGGGMDNGNPLQRSVQAVLQDQRERRHQGQQDALLSGNRQPFPQTQEPQHHQGRQQYHHNHHHRHNHRHYQYQHQLQNQRHRSAGRTHPAPADGVRPTASLATGEDPVICAAAVAELERNALIEQYKTQKVLSPRPNKVHMIAISELPGGPAVAGSGGGCGGGSSSGTGGGGGGYGGDSEAGSRVTPRSSLTQSPRGMTASPTTMAASAGAERGSAGPATEARGAHPAPIAAVASSTHAAAITLAQPGGGGGLFAVALEDHDAPMLLAPPLPPPPSAMAAATTATPAAAAERTPSRGRRLRMELLYEDDNYRMDLLVKHLLACRPSHRTAVGARDQRPLRGRSAGAAASRGGGVVGSRAPSASSRPLSATAALYTARQVRPRSRSVSHLQRRSGAYASALPAGAGQGGMYGGKVGGGSSRGGAYAAGEGKYVDTDDGSWEKMGMGPGWSALYAGGGGGFGAAVTDMARRSHQDLRPLSAPRTWRYT